MIRRTHSLGAMSSSLVEDDSHCDKSNDKCTQTAPTNLAESYGSGGGLSVLDHKIPRGSASPLTNVLFDRYLNASNGGMKGAICGSIESLSQEIIETLVPIEVDSLLIDPSVIDGHRAPCPRSVDTQTPSSPDAFADKENVSSPHSPHPNCWSFVHTPPEHLSRIDIAQQTAARIIQSSSPVTKEPELCRPSQNANSIKPSINSAFCPIAPLCHS